MLNQLKAKTGQGERVEEVTEKEETLGSLSCVGA